jgi:hypothetical protein
VEQFGPNKLKEITEQDIKDRTNAFLDLMRISLPAMA